MSCLSESGNHHSYLCRCKRCKLGSKRLRRFWGKHIRKAQRGQYCSMNTLSIKIANEQFIPKDAMITLISGERFVAGHQGPCGTYKLSTCK